MHWRWRKRVSRLVLSVVLVSLIPFGGIEASSLLKPLDNPLYQSYASNNSQTSHVPSSPIETLTSSKSSNNTDTLGSKFNSFDSHEQDTVSTATYNDRRTEEPTVSTATYNDMKFKDPNTVHVAKELIEKRTRNSKTFLNNDRTTTVQTATYSLNYFDGQSWQDIDTTIRRDNSDLNYTNSMLTNNFKVRLHNKGNNQSVTFSVYDQSVTYCAEGMNNITGVVYGNTINYPNAWVSTDLQYQIQNDQLKMELHLADSGAPKTFSFELKTKGVKHRINADGSIDFVNTDGKVNFKIPQMWVKDASSNVQRYDRLKVNVKQKGNKTSITMTFDDTGLKYPVVIDPTTTMVYGNVSIDGYSYYYDNVGRLSYILLPSANFLNYQYDLNGNLLKKVQSKYMSIASSNIGGWEVYKVTDNNPATLWSSAWHSSELNTEWIALDLGSTKFIGGVSLTPRATLSFPKDFKLQWSNDAITWTDILGQSYSGYTNNGSIQTFTFGSSVVARYVRVYATRLSTDDVGNYFFQLADFNVNISSVASSSNIGGWEVYKVTDNNPATLWSSAWHSSELNTEWIAMDLGSTKFISGVSLTPRATLSFPKDFKLQWSNDAVTWMDIPGQSYTFYVNNGSVLTVTLGSSVVARYVRVNATRLGRDDVGGYYFQLSDMSVVAQ